MSGQEKGTDFMGRWVCQDAIQQESELLYAAQVLFLIMLYDTSGHFWSFMES